MMKVLHCIYDHPSNPWVGGGGAVRLVEIYRRLEGDVDLTLLAGRFPGADALRDDAWQFTGAAHPYALSRLAYGAAATRRLRTGAYDAAVFDFSAYTPIRVPRARPVGVMLGQLASPTARTRWGPAAPLLRAWERNQLARARHVCAVSPWLLDTARPLLHPDARTTVVGAGVDERYFAVPRAEADEGYLLYYGRFDVFQKGIDVLLDAFSRLRSARPGLHLKVAGRGRDDARIGTMVRERGLDGAVEIVRDPPPERTHALMAGAAVQAMPSRFEGFGMVAAEAMAAGVPLVAAGIDAVPDVVGADGAILVPGEDAAALAEAVARLLDSPAERAALSTAARARARRYSWDHVARDHLAWLQRIAADEPQETFHGTR